MTKLRETSESWIAMVIFVMNISRWLRDIFCLCAHRVQINSFIASFSRLMSIAGQLRFQNVWRNGVFQESLIKFSFSVKHTLEPAGLGVIEVINIGLTFIFSPLVSVNVINFTKYCPGILIPFVLFCMLNFKKRGWNNFNFQPLKVE